MEGLDRFARFVNRRELEALRARLADGEHVLAATEARAGERAGLLALTDRRVLHLSKGWLRARLRSWPNREVHGIDVATNVDDGTVMLQTRLGPALFRLRKADARRFQAAWEKRPQGPGELLDFALPPAEARRRERLARLDRQLERGTITKAEYERSKRALVESAED